MEIQGVKQVTLSAELNIVQLIIVQGQLIMIIQILVQTHVLMDTVKLAVAVLLPIQMTPDVIPVLDCILLSA